jgi:hypothetical protein
VPEEREIAKVVFEDIREMFAGFVTRESESSDHEPELEFPEQPGLRFGVALYLYGDVLNICAGEFWGEWLPCSDRKVVAMYAEAVSGLLAGRFRIVEHSWNGHVIKALLQRPRGIGWQTIYRDYKGFWFWVPRFVTEQRVLQNLAA